MRAYKKHVEEKSRLGKKCQREKPQAESFLSTEPSEDYL